MNKQVYFITGASKGIGLEAVICALEAGNKVVATSRDSQKLTQTLLERGVEVGDNFLSVEMNFNEESIKEAVAKAINHFGKVDVLINNAGYAILGAIEEFSLGEVKQNFEVNVFGLLSVTQAVLPYMRKEHNGHIINIASISGTVTGPAQGIYSATKASVIMISESLADEVASFGIHVTAICPAGVRTDFLDNRSMKKPERNIAEYHVVAQTMRGLANLNHNQSGDPKLVAKALVEVAEMSNPPQRLYLGGSALRALEYKVNEVVETANKYSKLSVSIDN